jgi:hypothetical protein
MSTGEAEFAAWQKDHPCPGLMQVVKAARIVERSTPWGSSAEACSELKHQIEASQSPLERATLSAQLRQMEKELFEFRGDAAIRANGAFASPKNLALICSDLKAMLASAEQELAVRSASDPLSVVMANAIRQHIRPSIALYESAVAAAAAGGKLPASLQPFCASYLLRGCPWQEVSP